MMIININLKHILLLNRFSDERVIFSVVTSLVVNQAKTSKSVRLIGRCSFRQDLPLLDLSPVMNTIQSAFLEDQPLMVDLMADTHVG